MKRLRVILLVVLTLLLGRCSKEGDPVPGQPFDEGLFILNEGPFQNGTGTLSFWDRNTGEVRHKVFQEANDGLQLGNIVQSMTLFGGKAYIVVNNSERVVVADARTLKLDTILQGFEFPRYLMPVNDSIAYVSQWKLDGDTRRGNVAVLNLRTLRIEKHILTGEGTENLLLHRGKVYAANEGFLGRDSTLAVIDPQTHTLEKKIVVGDNPHSLAEDRHGALWVICRGHTADFSNPDDPRNTPSRLVRLENDQIAAVFEMETGAGNLLIHPDGERLFFTRGGFTGRIFLHHIEQDALSPEPLLPETFYDIALDPRTGELLAFDARDFVANGAMLRLSPAGQILESIPAGVIPRDAVGR
ncbi:MAG: hypothetical protein D6765_14620 [Bacteroidetes bacterium]|nr:MAG: hypothetical protein D6765_14620 [Bacteroidota bacterium]